MIDAVPCLLLVEGRNGEGSSCAKCPEGWCLLLAQGHHSPTDPCPLWG